MSNVILQVNDLTKDYGNFKLDGVSFSVSEGEIMGFIGRNGAGKTTTLRSLLRLTRYDRGNVKFFGQEFSEHEDEIKQQIGYMSGGVAYYPRKRLGNIIKITKSFYDNWDDEAYRHYMELFSLDENKRPRELSEGMKVKFNLVIALSHHARFLILDEPTSGLDPVSRDELLEIFLSLAREGVAILFSTHIIGDLDKCADSITYIRKGKIFASKGMDDFKRGFALVKFAADESIPHGEGVLGTSISRDGANALIYAEDAAAFPKQRIFVPTLEDIMIHLEKDGGQE